MQLEPIAHFRSPFTSKFGIPKQSGLVEELEGSIIFEPKYRNSDALRGIDGFDFLWLIWGFSANKRAATSPVVRPPVLGGNQRVGVFATRSPFRPNPLGLSSVRLKDVVWESTQGPIIHVTGADLMDGTPIYDIKPYVTYADCHAEARSGFVDRHPVQRLKVNIPDGFSFSATQSLKRCERYSNSTRVPIIMPTTKSCMACPLRASISIFACKMAPPLLSHVLTENHKSRQNYNTKKLALF